MEAIGPDWLILVRGSHISIRFPQLRTHRTYFLTRLANSDGPIITNPPNLLSYMSRRAQHFPSNLYPYPNHNHNHHHQPMPTHSMTCVHPCPPMLFKLRPCIPLPTYTKSWLDRTNKKSFTVTGFNPERFLMSILATSEKFDSDLELDAGMHKTDAHP